MPTANTNRKVVIVDYGVGNVHSVYRALKRAGVHSQLSRDPEALRDAAAIVLPGVGSFGAAMLSLRETGMNQAISAYVAQDRPLLAICLGMQLLGSSGTEGSEGAQSLAGLNVVPGRVRRLEPQGANVLKVPQIGWNSLVPVSDWSDTALGGLQTSSYFYYAHSYVLEPDASAGILAATVYGGHRFCAAIRRGALFCCQFHPELSGAPGARVLENFARQVNGN